MYHLFFNFFVDMASQTALIARHVQDIKWQVLNMTRAISKGFQESKAVVDEVGGGLSDMKGMMKMMDYEAFADFNFLTIAMIGLLYLLIGFGSLGMASMAVKVKRKKMKSGLSIFLAAFVWPIFWILMVFKEKVLIENDVNEFSVLAKATEDLNSKLMLLEAGVGALQEAQRQPHPKSILNRTPNGPNGLGGYRRNFGADDSGFGNK